MLTKDAEQSLRQEQFFVASGEISQRGFSYREAGDLLRELEDLGYIRPVTLNEDPEGIISLREWGVKREEKIPLDQLNQVAKFFEDRLTDEGKKFLEERTKESDFDREEKGITKGLVEREIIPQRGERFFLPGEIRVLKVLVALRALVDPELWRITLEGWREAAETNALITEMENTEHALRGVRRLVNTAVEEIGNLPGCENKEPKEILTELIGFSELTLENLPTALNRLKEVVSKLEVWPTEVSDSAEKKAIQSSEEKTRKTIQENTKTQKTKHQAKWDQRGTYIREALANLCPEIIVPVALGVLLGAGFAVIKKEELRPWMINGAIIGVSSGVFVTYAPAAIAKIREAWGERTRN